MIARAVVACVCLASRLTSRPVNSGRSSNARADGISSVLAATTSLPKKILAGRGDGADDVEPAAGGGHLAVEVDELGGGRCAAHLVLVVEQSALDSRGREAFEQPAKRGLAGGQDIRPRRWRAHRARRVGPRRGGGHQFAREKAFRPVVRFIVIVRLASAAFALAQFGPAARGVDCALEIRRIDEGLYHKDRMRMAGLPISAELCEHAAQCRRTEVGHRALRQEEKMDVVGDQGEAATALLIARPDPLIAGLRAEWHLKQIRNYSARSARPCHRSCEPVGPSI